MTESNTSPVAVAKTVARLREDVFYGDARLYNMRRHNHLHMTAADLMEILAARRCSLFPQGFQWGMMNRHGEGFETSPAPNQSDRARIIMAARQIRPIRAEGNVAYVPLTKGYEAVIDAADVPLVSGRNWFALVNRRGVYAVSHNYWGRSQSTIYMHRIIMNAAPGEVFDHADCDGLNNRRNNLRSATPTENARNVKTRTDNKSGFKGVSFHSPTGKWQANIRSRGQKHYLGLFSDPSDAASAYAAAATHLHGDFGRTS